MLRRKRGAEARDWRSSGATALLATDTMPPHPIFPVFLGVLSDKFAVVFMFHAKSMAKDVGQKLSKVLKNFE
jgi:hypothetical protein